MIDGHPKEQPPANAPPANGPEPTPSGSKGYLGCLGMIVVLVVLGFMFRAYWPWTSNLNPEQRAELSRLIGNFEGVSTNNADLTMQWAIVWNVRISLDDANQLSCSCVPVIYRNNAPRGVIFHVESVHAKYHDLGSAKPGYIEIARSDNNNGWKIYVEKSVLKSGKDITSITLSSSDFGQCILRRD